MQAGPTVEAVQQIWVTSLGIFFVVLVVVAVLLALILSTAEGIRDGVQEIWNTGQKIANNTVHIALLQRTNRRVDTILASARGVAGATAAIRDHARECPGCPACVLGPDWKREA